MAMTPVGPISRRGVDTYVYTVIFRAIPCVVIDDEKYWGMVAFVLNFY